MDIERIIDLALKAVRESVFDFEWSPAEAVVFRCKFGDKLNAMLEDTAQEGENWQETFTLTEIQKHMSADAFADLLVSLARQGQ